MYTLTKKFRFEASHRLMMHDGKCKRLHGHSWQGEIEVEGKRLRRSGPRDNMLVDYGDLGKILTPIVDQYLDHRHLNETLQSISPTSEYIAYWIYTIVAKRIPRGIRLVAVTIEETCTSRCRYEP